MYSIVWLQVFLFNANDLYIIICNYSYLIILICLYSVIWFDVSLSNTNNSQTSIWSIDGTPTGTLEQSGLRRNGNEGWLYTLQSSKNGTSPWDEV